MNTNTKIIKINSKKPEISKIQNAAEILKNGGLVALPTETVYGLGANGLNKKAVQKIFIAKGRPQDNPLILHVSDINQVHDLVQEIPDNAKILMKTFWPGPLTIIFKKTKLVPNIVTCELDSVAIRMPNNKIALELIKASGSPLAAPSANLSGKPSPTSATHVVEDLNNKIDAIIDGGDVEIGIESTVLDITQKIPQILRPGKITKEDLEKVIGNINENIQSEKPKSPGMKYKHYAPNAQVIIIDSEEEGKKIINSNTGKKIKILKYIDEIDMAKNLFKDFRDYDKKAYDMILVRAIKEENLGCAIMNRLRKASETKK